MMIFGKNKSDMWLIAGLGNPGLQYEKTRHNAGFMAADRLAEKYGAQFNKHKFEAVYADFKIKDNRILLVKPQTYMNNSGRAVKQLMSKYKIPPENLLVLYDDYDLPKGKVRIRASGSAGTHNGMRSVIGETGLTSFARIRIGIRDENVDIPIINYVLSEVRKEDYETFAAACKKAGEAAAEFAKGETIDRVMCKYNG